MIVHLELELTELENITEILIDFYNTYPTSDERVRDILTRLEVYKTIEESLFSWQRQKTTRIVHSDMEIGELELTIEILKIWCDDSVTSTEEVEKTITTLQMYLDTAKILDTYKFS